MRALGEKRIQNTLRDAIYLPPVSFCLALVSLVFFPMNFVPAWFCIKPRSTIQHVFFKVLLTGIGLGAGKSVLSFLFE